MEFRMVVDHEKVILVLKKKNIYIYNPYLKKQNSNRYLIVYNLKVKHLILLIINYHSNLYNSQNMIKCFTKILLL